MDIIQLWKITAVRLTENIACALQPRSVQRSGSSMKIVSGKFDNTVVGSSVLSSVLSSVSVTGMGPTMHVTIGMLQRRLSSYGHSSTTSEILAAIAKLPELLFTRLSMGKS